MTAVPINTGAGGGCRDHQHWWWWDLPKSSMLRLGVAIAVVNAGAARSGCHIGPSTLLMVIPT